ncbi:TIGR04283 family arsenosugar biosynthesis glycosyltransferase [Muricauda sp. CAU 1633]|uniref:TIGR04283 family arsenosugar biosynthesis glycosyltransferase n=1 Tax=Allomuricauda sp. CAU 1633 TaxID=2816036 RepID=UPI001A8DAF66|nr:TIGR04283 family arsenosugar biosynthesis glycosyltransferase [Muricauda sp. CAU 1633]MBO0321412.1 TIGR04283 family arsenosugar biosynthesis glycosyltransferase [Muricauda sp. CAU 1633]
MPNKNRSISIIIPVLNEELCLGKLLKHLNQKSTPSNNIEIICVDGGSTDKTREIAEQHRAKVVLSQKGRAKQMNLGAKHAKGDVLYFLHADTFPPHNFDQFILSAADSGFLAGCFRMRFDTKNLFLRFFAWFSRMNLLICRGGDQSLFVERELFTKSKGFDETYRIYEDTEFIGRLYKQTKFRVLPAYVVTSARKYQEIGILKLQFHFAVIHLKKYLGSSPDKLYRYYAKYITP